MPTLPWEKETCRWVVGLKSWIFFALKIGQHHREMGGVQSVAKWGNRRRKERGRRKKKSERKEETTMGNEKSKR
jgi:hypothetical protein